MKKTTKGAIAAGGAAVLLMGGAGTLAYWTANQSVDLGTISSGSISLSDISCGGWTYNDAEGTGPVTKVVPGDTVQQQCTATLTGVGDHLFADISVDPATVPDSLSLGSDTLTVTDDATGATATHVAVGSTPTPVAFTITVDFPYGAAANNDSQGQTTSATALDHVGVLVTQVHS